MRSVDLLDFSDLSQCKRTFRKNFVLSSQQFYSFPQYWLHFPLR